MVAVSPMAEGMDGCRFALTPVQAGMIYETLAGNDAAVNLEQVVVHLEDELCDVAALEAAWSRAIARHPALRLSFRQGPAGQVLQHVEAAFAATIRCEDWAGVADRDAALAAWLEEDRRCGVDVASADSWRLVLLRHSGRSATLVWTFSHLNLDGRSFRQVLTEVFTEYDGAEHDGGEADWPEPPVFRAHCEAVADADQTPAKEFFRAYLSGFDQATPLGLAGADRASPGGHAAQVLTAELDGAQTRALYARAASAGVDAGVSFATMIQAAWGLVLARTSGKADVVFGITRAGRHITPESRDMVGCLITTQPLRLAASANLRLDDMLGRLRMDQLAQRPHEALGLNDIASVTDVPSGSALLESLVVIEREMLGAAMRRLGGAWQNRRVDLLERGAMPFTLAAYGAGDGLGGTDGRLQLRLEYLPNRFSKAEATRYLTYVRAVLVAMATAPADALVQDLAMLPEAEVAELLALAEPPLPISDERPACIADAFEAVVARQPDAPALAHIGREAVLSYAGLNARANQIAQALAAKGIGPGDIVGLCLPRSMDFIAMMLATAKAGAAFLPMDPSYPVETLAHIAADSCANLIVAHVAEAWMAERPVLLMETLDADLAAEGAQGRAGPSRAGFAATRPAYVIYTSGTTGKPKGVVVTQASLVAHASAAIAQFGLTPQDRALQFAALSFDVALEEIVPTLLAGAKLVLRDEEIAGSPQAFVQAMAVQEISVLNLPTGFWQVLLGAMESGLAALPSCVRLMVVGGERMPPDALARWQALAGMPRLINGYGPTEATITSACFEPVGPVQGPEVPVGRAFGHARAYLLAPDRSLAPMGAVAQLWLGGDAVALGYLNQPELTAERFVSDGFAGQGRIYCSGDVAAWNAQGQIVVAGRSDRQIKLRGFRIEPGEIEALLEGLDGVAQVHVGVAHAGKAGARLVAWLRPSTAGRLPDLQSARAVVMAHLPAPKRPELVFVEDWPQTPGGKTDVARLPVPQREVKVAGLGVVDPQTERVAQIFAAVLGGDVPGPDESFFDLGGHSLLLLNLIGHIEAAFSQRLSITQVHTDPTPRGLSGLLGGPVSVAPGADLFDCLMPIQPLGGRVPIYGVHVLGVNGSFFRPLAGVMGLDQPIFGLTVGLLSADTPTTVASTADLYFRVIQAHRPEGPVGLVAVSLGSYMALELARRLVEAGRDVRLLAMMDAEGPAGRDKIRGPAWVRAHLGLLRAGGFAYACDLFGTKLGNLRHRLEGLRLKLRRRVLQEGPAVKSVDGFVAANEAAIRTYTPQPYAGHMTIIRAKGNVFDSEDAIAQGLGWAEVAAGGFDVIPVPGDHLSILEEPGVVKVAQAFSMALDRTK